MIERLKESFQRIRDWVRKNPRKALVIGILVVGGLVLLWILARRRQQGMAAGEEETLPGLPAMPTEPGPAEPGTPVGVPPGETPSPMPPNLGVPPLPPPPDLGIPPLPTDLFPPLPTDYSVPLPGLPPLSAPAPTEPFAQPSDLGRVSWVTAGYPEPQRSELQRAYELYRAGEWASYPQPAPSEPISWFRAYRPPPPPVSYPTAGFSEAVQAAYAAYREQERRALEIARDYYRQAAEQAAAARTPWAGVRPEVRQAYEAYRAGERASYPAPAQPTSARVPGRAAPAPVAPWRDVLPKVRQAYEAYRAGERASWNEAVARARQAAQRRTWRGRSGRV